MSLLNSIDRAHVLTAIETWDRAGGANYLLVRGTKPTHVLLHAGQEYDAGAIAGIAHGLATGNTLTPDEVPGGGKGAAKALAHLGFMIRDDSPPMEKVTRARAPRGSTTGKSTTGKAAKPVVVERPIALCDRCFLALPASGQCDNCD